MRCKMGREMLFHRMFPYASIYEILVETLHFNDPLVVFIAPHILTSNPINTDCR